jgi:hypothetical protein
MSFVRSCSLFALALCCLLPARSAHAVDATITITADNLYDLYLNGTYVGSQNNSEPSSYGWDLPEVWNVTLVPGNNLLAVFAQDASSNTSTGIGVLARIDIDGSLQYITDGSWRASQTGPAGWNTVSFDDSSWGPAFDCGAYDASPWGIFRPPIAAFSGTGARWIWAGTPPYYPGYGYYNPGGYQFAYLRRVITAPSVTSTAQTSSWGALKSRFR